MYSKQRTVDKLLFTEQLNKRNNAISENRQVLDRIVNILTLIGKRRLSSRFDKYAISNFSLKCRFIKNAFFSIFRGVNEATYLLGDLHRGNFLEILLLISKYDVVLKEHLNRVIQKSKHFYEEIINCLATSTLPKKSLSY